MSVIECSQGVYDCDYDELSPNTTCAAYNGEYQDPEENDWLIILSGIVAAIMAFGLGGNDASNSWSSSVGSGAIRPRTALLVGGIAEWVGAVLLGHGVSSTIQKGVSPVDDPDCWACGYCDSKMALYGLGMFCALASASIFLLLATFTAMPVSTTHAIVGGVIGVTVYGVGFECLSWDFHGLSGIMASWVISPVLAGFFATIILKITQYLIIQSDYPLLRALKGMPILCGWTTFLMTLLIMMKSTVTKEIEYWISSLVSLGLAIIVFFFVVQFIVPQVEIRLPSRTVSIRNEDYSPNLDVEEYEKLEDSDVNPDGLKEEDYTVEELDAIFVFRYLLVFQAVLESFAHGSNDTGNATGAFSAVYQTFQDGLDACDDVSSPILVMFFGGLFVFLGINILGIRVIQTVGTRLTKINFHRGYCIEFGSTLAVVIATIFEMPISTTHCQVGAVITIGIVEYGFKNVRWNMIGRIVVTWLISVPFSALLAAFLMFLLHPTVEN